MIQRAILIFSLLCFASVLFSQHSTGRSHKVSEALGRNQFFINAGSFYLPKSTIVIPGDIDKKRPDIFGSIHLSIESTKIRKFYKSKNEETSNNEIDEIKLTSFRASFIYGKNNNYVFVDGFEYPISGLSDRLTRAALGYYSGIGIIKKKHQFLMFNGGVDLFFSDHKSWFASSFLQSCTSQRLGLALIFELEHYVRIKKDRFLKFGVGMNSIELGVGREINGNLTLTNSQQQEDIMFHSNLAPKFFLVKLGIPLN